jgi:hypothetical protein
MPDQKFDLEYRTADNNDEFHGKEIELLLRSGKLIAGTIKRIVGRFLGDTMVDSGYMLDLADEGGPHYIKFSECEVEDELLHR